MGYVNMNVDELSLKILAVLQKNSRLSYSEIGRKVGLTQPAVAERIKKMEKSGIIKGYTIDIDNDSLGFNLMAYIHINIPGMLAHQMKKALEIATNCPDVIECHRITGSDDIAIKVVLNSRPHLQRMIDMFAPFGEIKTTIIIASFVNQNFVDLDLIIDRNRSKALK